MLCVTVAAGLAACSRDKLPNVDTGDILPRTEAATETEEIFETEREIADTEATVTTDGRTEVTEPETHPITEPITEAVTETAAPETEPATEPVTEPETERPNNMVMALDQMKEELVIYDMDGYSEGKSLDELEVWSMPAGHCSGLKYRSNTVFGDVIVVAGACTAMYAYPSGEKLWAAGSPGANPHSVELLPSGNLVVASSDDGILRLFYTSQLLTGKVGTASRYMEVALTDAHGVVWDPGRQVLWALGRYELKAYRLEGEGKREALVEIPEMVYALPEGKQWGHDLSPDYTDSRYLYATVGACVLRFDKETGIFSEEIPSADSLNRTNIKGFSNNRFGHYFASGEVGGGGIWGDWWKAPWCTDSIYYAYSDGSPDLNVLRLTSAERAFYKIRAFCGLYQ